MSVITHFPCDGAPCPRQISSVTEAMSIVNAHLRRSPKAHKERVDLRAFGAHLGTTFSQVELIPDSVFAEVRALYGVAPLVLLPPRAASSSSAAGQDGVVLFHDSHGILKGLPTNEVATRLATACGIPLQLRGDCFAARFSLDEASSSLGLGREAPPQMLVERDWLEAAQSANKPGASLPAAEAFSKTLQEALQVAERQHGEEATAVAVGSSDTPKDTAVDAGGEMSWEDAKDCVTVSVVVPLETKAKHIRCLIKEEWLTLEVSTLLPGKTVVVDGKLFQKVDAGSCSWGLEDGPAGMRTITVSLEKEKEMRWIVLTRAS